MKMKREEIAKRIMWEIGKPYGDSLKEFDRTVTYVRDTIKALKKDERQNQKLSRQQGIIGRNEKGPSRCSALYGSF